jgi:hypothetical protein
MSKESGKDFLKENWQEVALGSAGGMALAIIAYVGVRRVLDRLHDDTEQGPEAPDPSDNS